MKKAKKLKKKLRKIIDVRDTNKVAIIEWAKEEQATLSQMDANSKYVSRYIECTLLPKLKKLFHPVTCECCETEDAEVNVCYDCYNKPA